jgi:hypothetical protein
VNQKHLIKAANSKGKLVRAVLAYRQALLYYANESHWAVRDEVIQWVGDDDPTKVAEIVLGIRKQPVRLPDNKKKMEEK